VLEESTYYGCVDPCEGAGVATLERSAQAEGEAVKDNNRSMMGRNAGAPVAAHAPADDHSATPINRRMEEGVL